MLKKEIKKMSVQACLRKIYDNEIIETSINDLPKNELSDFILEVFNKGILNNYLCLYDNGANYNV